MALFDRLAAKVEARAQLAAERVRRAVETAIAEFPDVILRREGDKMVISACGLVRRWLHDGRLRFAFWRRG